MLQAEAFSEMFAECSDSERFGRVVTTVYDIEPQFGSINRHVVRSFAGH